MPLASAAGRALSLGCVAGFYLWAVSLAFYSGICLLLFAPGPFATFNLAFTCSLTVELFIACITFASVFFLFIIMYLLRRNFIEVVFF